MLNRVIDHSIDPTPAVSDTLDEAAAALPQLIEQLQGNRAPIAGIDDLIERAHALSRGEQGPPPTGGGGPGSGSGGDGTGRHTGTPGSAGGAGPASGAGSSGDGGARAAADPKTTDAAADDAMAVSPDAPGDEPALEEPADWSALELAPVAPAAESAGSNEEGAGSSDAMRGAGGD